MQPFKGIVFRTCAVEEGEEGARLLLSHFVPPLGRLTAFVLRYWPHLQAAKSGMAACIAAFVASAACQWLLMLTAKSGAAACVAAHILRLLSANG